MLQLIAVVFGILASGFVGSLIGGSKRNQYKVGCYLGMFLGPFGWIAALCLPDLRPKCGECGGSIVEDARRCKCCGAVLISAANPKSN